MKRRVSLLMLAGATPLLPAVAWSQSETRSADPEADHEVVYITADKRLKKESETAGTVTVVTTTDKDKLGIQSIDDLAKATPGLSYNAGNDRIYLRGVGRNTNNFGVEPGVANYIDGLYVPFATAAGRDGIFIQRVEVVSGPQGTLYGRNSVGGAINVISRRPGTEPAYEVRAGVGNYDQRKLEVAASGPIPVLDSLQYRFAGSEIYEGEGYFKNASGLASEGGRRDEQFFELQLQGALSDKVSWWIKADHTAYINYGPPGGRTGSGGSAPYSQQFGSITANDLSPRNGYAFAPGIAHTQVGTVGLNPATDDPYTFNTNVSQRAALPAAHSLTVELTFNTAFADIKTLSGYFNYHYVLTQDQDETPVTSFVCGAGAPAACAQGEMIFPSVTTGYDEKRSLFSNEVNILSNTPGPFQWMAGLYAYQENYRQQNTFSLFDQPGIEGPAPRNVTLSSFAPLTSTSAFAPNPLRRLLDDNNTGLTATYGAFGQIDWRFASNWQATLGVRYSDDWKTMSERGRLLCFKTCFFNMADITQATWTGKQFSSGGAEVSPQGVSSSTPANLSGVNYDALSGYSRRDMRDGWGATTGTAVVEWHPQPQTVGYIKYSRGYKAGGFGSGSTASQFAPHIETDEESVDALELGYKGFWPLLGLSADAAVFNNTYDNAQTPLNVTPTVGTPYSTIVNIPRVVSRGFELRASWRWEDFQAGLNYGYLDAEIRKGCCFIDGADTSALLPGARPVIVTSQGVGQDLKGNSQPNSPRNKIAFWVGTSWDDIFGGSLSANANWYWSDGTYTNVFSNTGLKSNDRNVYGLRAVWSSAHFTLIVSGDNIFNSKSFDAVQRVSRAGVIADQNRQYTLAPPRRIGAELQWHF